MPINWEEFDESLDQAITESVDAVDTKLASHISSITRLTDDEINELFPEPADLKKLSELLKIVKSAETRNNKVNSIINNAEEFSDVIFTLVDKLV
jgi:short-subunit dehydrogenase|tara:strand:+ start:143 stop:427 length:285 start_codon:yes stop_codon:yes gene_type:complete